MSGAGAAALADDATGDVTQRRRALERAERDAILRGIMQEAQQQDAGATSPAPEAAPAPSAPNTGGGFSARKVVSTAADMAAAVPAGVLAGAREAARTIDSAAEWLNTHVADLKVPLPSTGNETIDQLGAAAANPVKAVAEGLPQMAEPDTTAGSVVKGMAQFLTGFATGGRALRGVQATGRLAQAAKATAQGAISDAAFFSAQDATLSNLIESYPSLRNPVTELMATDPADPDWMNRGRRVMEGVGLGVATDAALGAIRSIAQWRRARAAGGGLDDAQVAAHAETMRADQVRRDWLVLGDPEKPLVEMRLVERPAAAVRGEMAKDDAAAAFGEHRVQAERLAEPTPRAETGQTGAGEGSTTGQSADAALRTPQGPAAPAASNAPFADGQTRSIADLDAFVREHVVDREPGAQVPLVTFQAGQMPDAAATSLRTLSPSFAEVPPTISIPSRVVKHIQERRPDEAAAIFSRIREAALQPDEIWPNPNRPESPWERPWLVKTDGRGLATIVEVRPNGNGIDAVSVIAPVGANQRRKAAAIIEKLDPEGRKATKVAYTPHPQGAAAPPPASEFPDLGSAKNVGRSDVFINFARIDGEEDVKGVLAQMAQMHASDIDAARRGVRSHAATEAAAGQEDAWRILMERRAENTPTGLNAEQSVAVRRLWTASADKLAEVAKRAAVEPSEGNLFAFRKMLATHALIQREAIAARTETARALESWKIPAGGGREQLRAIESVLREMGGSDLHRQMAERITALANAGMTTELDAVVRGSVAARSGNAFLQAWINGLLSGPKTHIVNMLSNSSVIAGQMAERAVAARISRLVGSDAGVELGEALAQWEGLKGGFRDAFANAEKSFRLGKTGFGVGKVEIGRPGSLSAEALGIAENSLPGAAFNFIDTVVSAPSRALSAEDEIFKTLGYRMELHAQAYRRAAQEARRSGADGGWIAQRRADLVLNPPEDLRLAAVDQALYQTFTARPGPGVQTLMRLRDDWPALRLLIPFVNTPANILKYAAERSPVAPLLAEWRADIGAGGARRHMAIARFATGTAALLTAIDVAQQGNMTGGGPIDQGGRELFFRDGKRAYAVKVGDRWYQYNRLDPIGMTLGVAADIHELLLNADAEDLADDGERVMVAAIAAISNNVMSKTYLSGLSAFFEAMNDPRRYGESYVQRLAGSLVPAGVAEIARAVDPYMLATGSMLDAMRARLPGASKELPIQHDLWGRPITWQSGLGTLYDVLSPIYSSKENPEPIDRELRRLGYMPQRPNRMVSFRLDGPAVEVSLRSRPDVWTRYVELAGNGIKHPQTGLGAKDFLNEVVTGKSDLSDQYAALPDEQKEKFVKGMLDDYRLLARQQLLEEFPELRQLVRAKTDDRLREAAQ